MWEREVHPDDWAKSLQKKVDEAMGSRTDFFVRMCIETPSNLKKDIRATDLIHEYTLIVERIAGELAGSHHEAESARKREKERA
eukprot:9499772-Pyramimonas_sp.AAC.1